MASPPAQAAPLSSVRSNANASRSDGPTDMAMAELQALGVAPTERSAVNIQQIGRLA